MFPDLLPSLPYLRSALSVVGSVSVGLLTVYNVEGGHRAIMFNRLTGIKDKVYPEGTHFMVQREKPRVLNPLDKLLRTMRPSSP
ncbi:PREDICTED: prohibitin-2, mitochondrial [Tarenaya hassleriana]|uniref:prohibitin-2, mitochondrial n=1 Tax=Tarenaya hassleriana TaxID=28532 RepID=UPI00053C8360|nr:PREDICTED: prohibitin-2, mitochondrial [Tarenaya hassleriana]